MINFALMNLVYLVETIIQKRLILPGIGKLSKVTLYDLYVRHYNRNKLGGHTMSERKVCNTISIKHFSVRFLLLL